MNFHHYIFFPSTVASLRRNKIPRQGPYVLFFMSQTTKIYKRARDGGICCSSNIIDEGYDGLRSCQKYSQHYVNAAKVKVTRTMLSAQRPFAI
jgi:hypothetical protein